MEVEIGDRVAASISLNNLGLVCTAQDQDSAACSYFRRSLHESLAVGHTPGILSNLAGIAHLRLRPGQPERGAQQEAAMAHSAQIDLDAIVAEILAEER